MHPHRRQFIVPEGIYLLSHSVGCLPAATLRAQEQFFALWGTLGGEAWDPWLAAIEAYRRALATLLNGHPHEFCPQANVSSAVAKLVGSLPRRPGKQKIVLTELDFPSLGFVLAQARRLGYTVEVLPATDGRVTFDRWQQALTPDTQLALLTHVSYGTSQLAPVEELIRSAHAHEIIAVVDIAQSVGVVPIDLRRWDADVVVGSCIKWLCGGPGAAFLWVNTAGIERFAPLDVGWFSHSDPFAFDIHDFTYAPDARRFWGGTPSILPFMVAHASLEVINTIGVPAIRAHNQALTARLVHGVQEQGLALRTPMDPARRGGTVCIGFPDPVQACARLNEQGIVVDVRPAFGVRCSPHIYNTVEEIDQLLACLCG